MHNMPEDKKTLDEKFRKLDEEWEKDIKKRCGVKKEEETINDVFAIFIDRVEKLEDRVGKLEQKNLEEKLRIRRNFTL